MALRLRFKLSKKINEDGKTKVEYPKRGNDTESLRYQQPGHCVRSGADPSFEWTSELSWLIRSFDSHAAGPIDSAHYTIGV